MDVPVVVDGRNCLEPDRLTAAGFEYYGMGRLLRPMKGEQPQCDQQRW